MNNALGWSIAASFTTIFGLFVTQNTFACESGEALKGLENATYSGIEEQAVTLSQGRWEGPAYAEGGASRPTVGLVEDVLFTGDLDADGENELVTMLWQSAGGTGSNIFIAVMKPKAGGYENISSALVGDRVKLRSGRIDSGRIILDVLQAGENDAMCCQTELAERSWSLQDSHLEEHEMQVTGTLSPVVLEGGHWRLTHLNRESRLPDDAEVTLSFNAGQVSGKSACNRYSAEIREGDSPGEIIIGQVMGTRMACPEPLMGIEIRYLDALASVTSFSFHACSLALNGQTVGGDPFSMLFASADKDAP